MQDLTPQAPESLPVRVLKVASCPSLSGRSILTYQVACRDQEIVIRISENSGSGYFSKAWVPFDKVDALIPEGGKLTFYTLQPIYEGLSINTAGFLLAALKGLNVVKVSEANPRAHTRANVDAFVTQVRALMATNVSLGETARAEAPRGRRKGKAGTAAAAV